MKDGSIRKYEIRKAALLRTSENRLNPMKGRHILAVDDDKAILDLIEEFLEDYNYKVSTATNTAAMAQILKKEKVDLIVLDLKLRPVQLNRARLEPPCLT